MNPWLPTLAIAYLLGSIPFGYLLVRMFRKQDIRSLGSGNIGATNVVRSGAKGLGVATLLLDALKGVCAVLVAGFIARSAGMTDLYDLAAAAATFAVLGHVFPVWLGFRGGKGVATALGAFLAISPVATLLSVAVFLVVLLLSHYVSLASIVAVAAFPVAALLLTHGRLSRIVLTAFVLVPCIVIAKHHANIRRLLSGTENRFGSGRKAVA